VIRRMLSTRTARTCAIVAALAALVLAAGALAYFSSSGSSRAAAIVGSVTAAGNPTAQVSSGSVNVTWQAAALSSGGAVQGYKVTRSDGTTICGSPALLATLSCTDSSPSTGSTYTYTVIAVFHSFTASATSNSVTVLVAPTIGSKPSNPSAGASAAFGFSGGGGTSYECKLDGGLFASCSSPAGYGSLSSGSHTFTVHAVKGAITGPDASYTWTVDPAAPSISTTPSNPSASTSPSFVFSHSEASYTFKCQLDGAGFSGCSSPAAFTNLSSGSHTLQIEGVSTDGSVTTSASYSWTVDASAPSITAQPPNPTTSTSASFSFSHAQSAYTLKCRLDSAGFTSCTSPKPYSALADGSHTFQVEAIATDGSQTSAATYTWVVDTTKPTDALSLATGGTGAYINAVGTRLYYKGNAAGSFKLNDTVTDGGSGPASATFPAIATTGWTHNAETVSSGSGTAPTVAYSSSTFSWTANPSGNPSGYTVTSKDVVGNTSSGAALAFTSDTTAPTAGALTVNGTAATAGGSSSSTTSTGFTIGSRTDYTETQTTTASGLASSSLTVQSTALTSGTCGSAGSGGPFTTPTTITGTTQPSGLVAGYCYLYTLTGTDNVGNSASISTTVKVSTSPTVTSTTPSSRDRGAANQTIAVNGTGFASGATVAFSGSGITTNSTTFVSPTEIDLNVTIGGSATLSSRTVTVTNPDGGSGSLASAFSVDDVPNVSSLSPSALAQGVSNQTVTLTGTNLQPGTPLAVTITGHTGVSVNSTTFTDSTHLSLNVSVAASATIASNYTVNLVNGDGTTDTLSNGFAVDAQPTITTISPTSRGQGAASQSITINGTGFLTGAAASFSGTGITVNSTTRISSTQLTANITIASNASTNARDVTVTNTDAGSVTKSGAFTVNAAPTVTSVSPGTLSRGASNQNITINGTGFTSGATASFSGSGITVNSTTFNSAAKLTANVTVSSSAAVGDRDVTVTNADAGTGTCSACFHIFAFSEAGGATISSGTSVTATSVTLSSGSAYLLFAYSKSGSGDTATPSSSGFTTAPTFTAIGSRQDYGAGGAHNWAWYTTGGSGTGSVKLTFAQSTTRAYIEVIAIGGANTAIPVVTSNEGFATGSSTTATANLPNAPSDGNAEIVFWTTDSNNGNNNDPGSSSALITPLGNIYTNNSTGTDDLFTGSPPQATLNLTQNGSRSWGTIALEISSS
jgi:Quinohemoprotein amine dehydrogenase, alpha subunit domain III